jgi:uncharacterized protein YqgV (UPF0045/DUF77 family)
MTNHLVTIGIQIIPKSKKHQAYDLVDVAIAVIQNSGIKHQITPFETVMEGDYEEIMSICKKAEKAVLDAGADECLVYYRIHYRKNGDVTFEEKKLDR